MYGALSAIEGCEAFLDLCANTKVKSWYDDVQKSVENSEGQIILSKTWTIDAYAKCFIY